ncbi:MAG: Cof-type HAD-IIB family hydrolase [Oscillospiraceae bacterium]
MDFSKVILMTDLDGTLLTDDKRILDKDMAAIERFRAGGGIFTMATGRGYSMARSVAEKLALDAPAVLFNGAAVFDFSQDKFLWRCDIGGRAADIITRVAARFPDVGVEVLREHSVYVPFLNETEQWHLDLEGVKAELCPLAEIPTDGWLKVLFAYPPEKMDALVEFVENDPALRGVQWLRSAPMFFECLPEGIDKAAGFRELIRVIGAEDRFTVAAGDFMNDTHMIQNADLGAAVASAQPSVKAAADIIVCDNNSGAMAQIIDCIERL